jgi:hypothetical protein
VSLEHVCVAMSINSSDVVNPCSGREHKVLQ